MKAEAIEPVTEAAFTRQVLALAKLHGWRTAHFRPGRTKAGGWRTAVQGDGKGFLDILALRGSDKFVAELKVGKGKLTPEQWSWYHAWRFSGVACFIWLPRNWPEIERILEKGTT